MSQCGLCDEAHLATHYCPTCQEFMCRTLADLHPKLKATKHHTFQDADPTAELETNIHMALKELDKASSDLLVAYADALPSRDLPDSVRVSERAHTVFRELIQAGSILNDQHDALLNLQQSLDPLDHRAMRDILTHSMFRTELSLEGFKQGTSNLPNLISGWGSRGSRRGQFDKARDLAVSSTGEVYVCDAGRIQVFDSRGHFARAWHVPQPARLCVALWDDVYVVEQDSTRVHRFSTDGAHVGTFTHTLVSYDWAVDVAASATEVYVLSSCVRVFTPDGQVLRAWLGPPKPKSLCIGPDGCVYIVSNTHLHIYDSNGVDIAARGGLQDAKRVHVHGEKVYVTESKVVRVFKMDGALFAVLAHSNAPRAVAVTPDRVYICEASSIEIQANS